MKLLYLHTGVLKNKDFFEKSMMLISKERREKILKYQKEQTARLSLGVGLLLEIAMDQEGIRNKEIQNEEYGKPYLPVENFHFNLSHSGEYAICVYDRLPVGVDLQIIKDTTPKHTKRILSETELDYLLSLDEEERRTEFYNIWSVKESIVKWDGRGLRIPLTDLTVIDKGQKVKEIDFERKKVYLYFSDLLLPGYALSICSEKQILMERIQEIDTNFLTKY